MASFVPVLVCQPGEVPRLGEPLIDESLRFVPPVRGPTRCWRRCST